MVRPLNEEDVSESFSLPELAVVMLSASGLLLQTRNEFILDTAADWGMISFLGAILKLDPVKLLALRNSLAVTLYFRQIHRRESSGLVRCGE